MRSILDPACVVYVSVCNAHEVFQHPPPQTAAGNLNYLPIDSPPSPQSSKSLSTCSNTNIRHAPRSRTPVTEMRFKKTRIAFSVICGILCLLIIALWIRSQSTADAIQIRVNSTWGTQIGSVFGCVDLSISDTFYLQRIWVIGTHPYSNTDIPPDLSTLWGRFAVSNHTNNYGLMFPCWFLVLLTGIFAGAIYPWRHVHWRFSLRALLICVTCISLILGLIIFFSKK